MSKLRHGFDLIKFKIGQRLKGVPVSDEPWFDGETLEWFEKRLPEAKSYMEFGSGGSTLMASRLAVPTVSTEGDHFFAQAVAKHLYDGHRVQVVKPPIGLTGLWGVPIPGSPSPARVQKWRRYIDLPFEVLTECQHPFPDLFLVDGRFRRACALRAALETKRAGQQAELLFDDYQSEGRKHYSQIEDKIGQPRLIGRSAIFSLGANIEVTQADIDQAMLDYR